MLFLEKPVRALFVLLLFVLGLYFITQDVLAENDYVPNQLIIKYKENANSSALHSRLADRSIAAGKKIQELRLEVVDVPPGDLLALQEELSQDPDIEYVEKNYYYKLYAVPNDQYYPNQETWFNVISAQQAWDNETGNPDVVLALIDTGIDPSQEDLIGGKVLPGCKVSGPDYDHLNCNPDVSDMVGHGTAVAGVAAANTHNTIGVAGICWGCTILPINVTNDSGSFGTIDLIEGIMYATNYAIENPTKRVVVNMSLGRFCSSDAPGETQLEQDAINFGWENGVLFVAARGQTGGADVICPAFQDHVIAVSGTFLDDTFYTPSSWNNVDVAAPASPIFTISLLHGIGYGAWGGTSFSSAVVTGVAGLAWSANMSMTNWQVDQVLRISADDIGLDPVFVGAGRINANAAVLQAASPPTPTPPPTPPPTLDPNALRIGAPGGIGFITGKGKGQILYSGAEPGAVLYLLHTIAPGDGETVIGGNGPCAGQIITEFPDATKVTRSTADELGRGSFNFNVSGKWQGHTVRFQAYTHSKATVCEISGRTSKTVPIP